MPNPINVRQVGPDPDGLGGISTVIRFLLAEQAGDSGLRVASLPTATEGHSLAKAARFGGAMGRLGFQGLGGRVDLLHVHTSSGASFSRKVAIMDLGRRLGIPSVLHVHGSNFDVWYEEGGEALRAKIRSGVSRAAAVIALSESWAVFLRGLTDRPVHVVYNSVPLDAFVQPRPPREAGPMRLLFLGQLGRRKGTFDLLRAVAALNDADAPCPVSLQMGGDGEVDAVQAMIADLGLEASVAYLGWVDADRKRDLLAQADVFVLPSYHEGLPMAILEAMAAGLPVLTTPINGIPEAITHEENGLFVQPGDVDGIAAAIRRLDRDPDLRRVLGAAARRTVEERFSIAGAAAGLRDVYARVLGEATP